MLKKICIVTAFIAFVGLMVVQMVYAQPGRGHGPGGIGEGKLTEMNKGDYGKQGREHGQSYERSGRDGTKYRYFNDDQRSYIQDYYANQYTRGHCPPGLAKKNNGCMPPGQAKQWAIGRPLAREVIFHDLPSRVTMQLGPPPTGHRYVRVLQDILLITTGMGVVVDAIDDLNWEFSR